MNLRSLPTGGRGGARSVEEGTSCGRQTLLNTGRFCRVSDMEQDRTILKPSRVELSAELPEEATNLAKSEDASCTLTYNVAFQQYTNGQVQRYAMIRGPHVALVGGIDSTILGTLDIKCESRQNDHYSSRTNNTISINFNATTAAETQGTTLAVGCQVAYVALKTVQADGQITAVPLETYSRFKWSLKFDYWPYTRLAISVAVKSVATHYFFNSPVKDNNLRSSLLETADSTGDLNLICKDKSKVPAHSAVLVSIPYFATKFKKEWSEPWNLNKKLDLELPCPVDPPVIQAFLRYVYGDVWSLGQLDASNASMMQDLFSLAEACGVSELCSAIDDIVIVSPTDKTAASSWLELLRKEHASVIPKIREKVRKIVKDRFSKPALWESLTVEQLALFEEVAKTNMTWEDSQTNSSASIPK